MGVAPHWYLNKWLGEGMGMGNIYDYGCGHGVGLLEEMVHMFDMSAIRRGDGRAWKVVVMGAALNRHIPME